jgi:hypothetical protein
METATQLAIFLANQPGALARVCDALAQAKINILALSTNDTVDHTVIRMVVSDPRKALFLFEERGLLVVETDVLVLEGDNRPGNLSQLTRTLAAAKVNIDYIYCATAAKAKHGLLVLKVSDLKKARAVLARPARGQ